MAGPHPSFSLSLVRGSSQRTRVILAANTARTNTPVHHVVVGSSSLCDWRIGARGVRSRHFRLTYARGRLRIEDQCEAGSVRVDGLRVGARLELPCSARIEFGDAAIDVCVETGHSVSVAA